MIDVPCPTISAISLELPDREEVSAAQLAECFRDAPKLEFGQPWESTALQPEDAPSPGVAQLAWDPRSGCLGVFFSLLDEDIFTQAEPGVENQRLWSLGDSAELFLGLAGDPAYHEYQAAPGGQVLRLRYPCPLTQLPQWPHDLKEYFRAALPGEDIRVWLMPECLHWHVYMRLPLGELSGTTPRAGQRWDLNLSRYDYTRAADAGQPQPAPVLSSVAPLRKRHFHRREEWLTLVLG